MTMLVRLQKHSPSRLFYFRCLPLTSRWPVIPCLVTPFFLHILFLACSISHLMVNFFHYAMYITIMLLLNLHSCYLLATRLFFPLLRCISISLFNCFLGFSVDIVLCVSHVISLSVCVKIMYYFVPSVILYFVCSNDNC